MEVKKVQKLYKLLAHNKLRRKRFRIFLLAGISFSWLAVLISASTSLYLNNKKGQSVLGINISRFETYAKSDLLSPVVTIATDLTPTPTPIDTPTPVPTIRPKPTIRPIFIPTHTPTPTSANPSQYTAQRINDVTWRVNNVANDDKMASPQDILNALNSYRGSHGLSNLSWDGGLASYAQSRADLFAKNGELDSHAGFTNFMNNGGFDKTGFNSLGENSAYLAGPMNGEHIIKSIFGADSSHDGQQLDPSWTHAGVGVNGVAININFGKNKK